MSGSGAKINYLESMRGIAALVVVLTHFCGTFIPSITQGTAVPNHGLGEGFINGTPLGILVAGNFSVCLFFVLSGFVLTYGYFRIKDTSMLRKAAFKRYFRLMPPAAASVGIAYILMKTGHIYIQQASAISGSVDAALLWNFTPHLKDAIYQAFYGVFLTENNSYNPVLWTMRVEFLGSFLIFGVAALFSRHPWRYFIYAALAIVLFKTWFLGFVFGVALADLWANGHLRFAFHWVVFSALAIFGLYLGSYSPAGESGHLYYGLLPVFGATPVQALGIWHTLGALIIMVVVLNWTAAQRALNVKPLVWLGRISFSLYLIHLLIIASFSSYLFTSLTMSFGYRTSVAITFAVSLFVILLASWVYTNILDTTSIRWAAWIGAKAQAKEPASDSAPQSQSEGSFPPRRFPTLRRRPRKRPITA